VGPGQIDQPEQQMPEHRPGGAAAERPHGFQARCDERVHREQDDQRQDRDARPGQRDDSDGDGEDTPHHQGRTE
jgi:hypothetical protein